MARARRYPAELRSQVIAYCVEHGPAEAARHWPDINPATMRSWCSRAGVATVAAERMQAASAASQLRWQERRDRLVHEIGAAAETALELTRTRLDAGNGREAKDAALTLAILVDKAQLLSGGHTARYGTETERREVLDDARDRALRLAS